MKLFSFGCDGGSTSGVTGFWIIELKNWFSIVLLKFNEGTRENYHSHAFNAWTWFLWGSVEEQHLHGRSVCWKPSLYPKYTTKDTFHRVKAIQTTYALSIRGPWDNTWKEYDPQKQQFIQLTHGRKQVN